VSLLSLIASRANWASHRHLSDDAVAELWSAATAEGRAASHPHLTTCAECRFRYADFVRWLEGIKHEAHTEADLAMPPERLAAQQAQIFRRLEALERPARVIAFPKAVRTIIATRGARQRWVVTAAAAGLVIGVAAGQLVDLRRALQPSSRSAKSVVADSATTRPVSPANNLVPIDEAFLYGDLELSARSVADNSLRAFDDFTPRARDFDR
jgi:hypothetical protein